MKKIFVLEGLDCANCAAKLEREICKIEGVNSASVNFITGKLRLEAEDHQIERVIEKVIKTAKRIEPGMAIKAK